MLVALVDYNIALSIVDHTQSMIIYVPGEYNKTGVSHSLKIACVYAPFPLYPCTSVTQSVVNFIYNYSEQHARWLTDHSKILLYLLFQC